MAASSGTLSVSALAVLASVIFWGYCLIDRACPPTNGRCEP
jgi:hypothetical protein